MAADNARPLLLLCLLLAGCAPLRGIEAARVLADVAAGSGPSELKATTLAPHRAPIAYRIGGRDREGDLYRPAEGAAAALVLVPGLSPAGRNDPRLVAFATTLARAGFVVLVPDIPNLRALRVSAADAQAIADAVRHLTRPDEAGPSAAGIAAISYAVGPAVIAALMEDIRGRVRFILAIGGYWDLEAAVTYVTTGCWRERPGDPWRCRRPNAYGKWVFVNSNAGRLRSPRDRKALAEMARRKLADPQAQIGGLIGLLGPEGRSVHALVTNDDPARVPALIAALPEPIRMEMAALDLKRYDLSALRARLILVHGRDDAIIPYSQSKALAAAVPESRAELHLVDSLAHVDLRPGDLPDALALWRAAYELLAERDAAPDFDAATSRPVEARQ